MHTQTFENMAHCRIVLIVSLDKITTFLICYVQKT